jgi:hypothetical protein
MGAGRPCLKQVEDLIQRKSLAVDYALAQVRRSSISPDDEADWVAKFKTYIDHAGPKVFERDFELFNGHLKSRYNELSPAHDFAQAFLIYAQLSPGEASNSLIKF